MRHLPACTVRLHAANPTDPYHGRAHHLRSRRGTPIPSNWLTRVLRQAVILYGGLGTRLGALTAQPPKPLLPVSGLPFLNLLLLELGRHCVIRSLLLASFEAHPIRSLDAAEGPIRPGDPGSSRSSVEPATGARQRGMVKDRPECTSVIPAPIL
jgi:GTP:adenosylcobinamide-phosphate guanylyltransferase